MLRIRDIDNQKEADKIKEAEKYARKEALGLLPEPEVEVEEEDDKKKKKAAPGSKKKKVIEPTPEELEEKRLKEAFELELKTYGRTWIWEGYYNDTEHHQNWLEGAERLRHINAQVIEDIEDWILLDGFMDQTDIRKWPEDIEPKIKKHQAETRERAKMEIEEEEKEFAEECKVEDQKRKFAEPYRPNNRIWNFIEEKDPTPHVLRSTSDPRQAYIDGRVDTLLEIIRNIAVNLKNQESENWKRLNKFT